MNNTIYGGNTATGTGISVSLGAAPTLMNNIIANTATGISVDATSTPKTVLEANLYQNNTSNGVGGSEQFAIQLQPSDALFIDPTHNDFYLAEGSKAIDSSLNSLQDRPAIVSVDAPLGIPAEPIIAPAYDELGQLRVDDPSVSSPPGLGQNVFIDRGALDRSDFTDPTAALASPAPTTPTTATVYGQFPSQFSIQLSDGTGSGIKTSTVTTNPALTFTLTGPDPNNPTNTITLKPTTNYLFSYDATNGLVRFTAAQGIWIPGTYTISVTNTGVNGVTDLAGNPLAPNNAGGTTSFTITVAAKAPAPWENPTNPLDVDGDGTVAPIDALILINAINSGHLINGMSFPGGVLPIPGSPPPYYDVNGDGLLTPADVNQIITYLNSQNVAQAIAAQASPAVATPASVDVQPAPVTVSTSVAADLSVSPAAVSAPASPVAASAVSAAPMSNVIGEVGFASPPITRQRLPRHPRRFPTPQPVALRLRPLRAATGSRPRPARLRRTTRLSRRNIRTTNWSSKPPWPT